jgi:hypothetical protein
MKVIRFGCLYLSLSGAVLGCGEGGIDQKLLNQLTPAEVIQVCHEASASYDSIVSTAGACQAQGAIAAFTVSEFDATATDAALQATCTSAYDKCIAAPVNPSTCDPWPAGTATVAENRTCIHDLAVQFGQVIQLSPACSAVTRASVAPIGDPAVVSPDAPPSCTSFNMKCHR